ncbi:MAG: response regulator [Planctomycetes bacterium]|nr:response regulator [Planctomycetota bacterium]
MKTVLIVEDDPNQRLLIREELEDRGYSVREAGNGKEGLASFREQKPDLVIMDIRMPEMDGIETLMHLIEEQKSVPVILHSAYSKYKKNYMSWCADAYIVKSSDMTDLLEKVDEFLKKDTI